MKQINSLGIVLNRIDYQEADRIITFLTPDNGKVKVMARGVRKVKSKLAGGIELFSVSQISYIPGRGDISTLISSRLLNYFSHIVKDLNRTLLAYELIKNINKLTEDAVDTDYYNLLVKTLDGLDNDLISKEIVEFWFTMQLLSISGHKPNLELDETGAKLAENRNYKFDFERMGLVNSPNGEVSSNDIKLLRYAMVTSSPDVLANLKGNSIDFNSSLTIAKMLQRQVLHV